MEKPCAWTSEWVRAPDFSMDLCNLQRMNNKFKVIYTKSRQKLKTLDWKSQMNSGFPNECWVYFEREFGLGNVMWNRLKIECNIVKHSRESRAKNNDCQNFHLKMNRFFVLWLIKLRKIENFTFSGREIGYILAKLSTVVSSGVHLLNIEIQKSAKTKENFRFFGNNVICVCIRYGP